MTRKAVPTTKKIGHLVGRFLSNFHNVFVTLVIYLVLGFGTYVWLAIDLGSFSGKSTNIAYKVATGSDPLEYVDVINKFPFLWAWILIFHVLSWLVVPVLTATAVDAAYRIAEETRIEAERDMRLRLRAIGRARGLSGLDLDKFVEDTIEMFQSRLKKR